MRSWATDAALVDEALEALLVRHRSAEVDASCAAYDKHPADEPDELGDLASLRQAIVAPCTTTIRGLASEVVLEPGDDPIPQRSAVNLDTVESVSVAGLVERLGRVADARMRARGPTMKIHLSNVYVDDQDNALRYYTEVLGTCGNPIQMAASHTFG